MKNDNCYQNPWAGLSSYEDPAKSEQKLKFCGRDNETKEVTRLIDDNFFVTLYGKSGIGKTSLLNAGVFPALRREQYTPLSLRLSMTDEAQSFQDIITAAIERAIEECGGSVKVVNVVEEQTDRSAIDYLWNWFVRHCFLNADGQTTFPVIVFDQFEEVFRHEESRQKTEILLTQLHYLIDESHALNNCIVDGEQYYYDFNFRFVLSIREDDLYRLEDSIDNCALTALKHCRYRLRSLSEKSAEAVILVPGEGLFKKEEQKGIVDTIIGIARNKEDKSISTNVLSLICSRIFVDFQKSGTDHITPFLVDSFIKGNPFERFYNEATRGFSNKEKSYIEDNLVDSTGRRNSIPESNFLLHMPKGQQLLEGDTRILQRTSTSSDGGNYRIELIHDSFCEPLSKQKEKRKRKKQILWMTSGISVALLAIVLVFILLHHFAMVTLNDVCKQQTISMDKMELLANDCNMLNDELALFYQTVDKSDTIKEISELFMLKIIERAEKNVDSYRRTFSAPEFKMNGIELFILELYNIKSEELQGFSLYYQSVFQDMDEVIVNIREQIYQHDYSKLKNAIIICILNRMSYSINAFYFGYLGSISLLPESARSIHYETEKKWNNFPKGIPLDLSQEEYEQFQVHELKCFEEEAKWQRSLLDELEEQMERLKEQAGINSQEQVF